MKKILIVFFISSISFSCTKDEDKIPTIGVYGEPGKAMVYNLKLIDPEIQSKTVTALGNEHGNVRIVVNGNYVIYESEPDFTSDIVTVSANGSPIGNIRFLADNVDNTCKTFARSYELTIKKNSASFFQMTLTEPGRCGNKAFIDEVVFYTNITGPPSTVWLYYNEGIQSETALPEDFVGMSEAIYEVGYSPFLAAPYRIEGIPTWIDPTTVDIHKLAILVSGLIRIRVEE